MAVPNSIGQPPDTVDASQDAQNGGEESQDSDAGTFLVDKAVFGEKLPEPGESVACVFVRAYEDEVELKLADAETETEGEASGTAESGDRAIGMMAE